MDPWKIVGRVLFLPLRVVVFQLRELKMGQDKFLLVTDLIAVSVSAVCDAVKGLKEGVENFDPLVIIQASSQNARKLPPSTIKHHMDNNHLDHEAVVVHPHQRLVGTFTPKWVFEALPVLTKYNSHILYGGTILVNQCFKRDSEKVHPIGLVPVQAP
ncbi:anamorsin homolog [Striga asiatica]|uniref:Anamorsin homolog n=1 Tax=Striga asiatica TaxID=4170 RepID=A0A5A7PMR7_STRAF|nr:anamorsin homolog [Striga asiatica]